MSTSISPTAPEAVQEGKAKKSRKGKPLYPLAEDVKVDKTPEDFDYTTQRMTKAQFVDVPTYMEHQAGILDKKAAKLRADAEDYRVNGPPKRGGGKAKLAARLSKLEAKLAELGVNVDELFADEDE